MEKKIKAAENQGSPAHRETPIAFIGTNGSGEHGPHRHIHGQTGSPKPRGHHGSVPAIPSAPVAAAAGEARPGAPLGRGV